MPLRLDTLVITLGETPQVVTETVWALLSQPEPFVPRAVHLVTTESGRKLCQEQLIGAGSQLAHVFAHFGHAPVEPAIHLPRDRDGQELHDVRTEAENAAFANTLTSLVRRIASDPATRLHVSLAGGRKTMSNYAGAAISLFGRNGDELSHVLVEPAELEHCREFYWPGQSVTEVTTRSGKVIRAENARVLLVRSPYLRLRHLLPADALPEGALDYGAIVDTAQARLDSWRMVLRVEDRSVQVGRATIRLGHQEFAFVQLLAVARQEGWQGAGPDGIGREHGGWLTFDDVLRPAGRAGSRFLEFYEDSFARETTQSDDFGEMFRSAVASRDGDRIIALTARLSQIKSKAARSLRNGVADAVARRSAGITTVKRGSVSRFGLLVAPDDVEIVPRP